MIDSTPNQIFDLFSHKSFFDSEKCFEIIGEMRDCQPVQAAIYGIGETGSVDERVRKVSRITPSRETVEYVRERLLNCKTQVAEHFGVELVNCEEPQFLHYRIGDFFVAHQDGNTGLIRSEGEQSRKISVVIFLNRQAETEESDAYCGGSLVFTEWRPTHECGEFHLSVETGNLVAFRAETTHEVRNVTHGERFTIASWYI